MFIIRIGKNRKTFDHTKWRSWVEDYSDEIAGHKGFAKDFEKFLKRKLQDEFPME